jgi:phage terminase small subunit
VTARASTARAARATGRPAHLPDDVAPVWDEVVLAYGEDAERIYGPDLEAYCGQIARLRDAQRRLADEGIVVADPKGHPIPHPALAIERTAQDEIRKWGAAFKRPRRAGGDRGRRA